MKECAGWESVRPQSVGRALSVKAQNWRINLPCTSAGEDNSQPREKYAYSAACQNNTQLVRILDYYN